ncbi:MAG: amidohydrolase [Prevotellaceae bacterium]|jgi:5-methylthioadenosine/S-adenosylhomocysteine deaminase|nr:amidohydrolase [Prevotellaceae bacterium]
MTSILIKNVWLNHDTVDIFIEGNIIKNIGKNLEVTAQQTIDGSRKAVIPGLINGHGHAAMTLFRGWGDDMPLEQWLYDRIWPREAKMTEEDVYWGVKLACLEMIKTGATCANDMYTMFNATAQAATDMGIRMVAAPTIWDFFDKKNAEAAKKQTLQYFKDAQKYGSRITFAAAPHAIYTVSSELLQWSNDFAGDHDLLIHLHLAESRTEHDNAVQQFGLSPVRYLHKLGLLSPRLILAHVVWLDDDEIKMLADHEVKVVHNPNSNLKMASGYQFKYQEMKRAGITIGLGTDGCASSNNLDLIEAMKTASLMQKAWRYNPTFFPAQEALDCVTINGAKMLRLHAGKIETGRLADLCLIDLNCAAFTPNFDFVSNLVYAANGSCVDTVICDGRILMQNKQAPGEQEILDRAAAVAHQLTSRQ